MYQCSCLPGWTGDGTSSADINEFDAIADELAWKQHTSTKLALTIANVTLVSLVKMVLVELVMISMNVPLVDMIVMMLPFAPTYLVRGAVIVVLDMTVMELPVSIKMNV